MRRVYAMGGYGHQLSGTCGRENGERMAAALQRVKAAGLEVTCERQ